MLQGSKDVQLTDHWGNRKFATVEVLFAYDPPHPAFKYGDPDRWSPLYPGEYDITEILFRGNKLKGKKSVIWDNPFYLDQIYDAIQGEE